MQLFLERDRIEEYIFSLESDNIIYCHNKIILLNNQHDKNVMVGLIQATASLSIVLK